MQQEPSETPQQDKQEEAASGSPQAAQHAFTDINLAPGDRLQIYALNHADRTRHICRMVGYLEGASLLVTTPTHKGARIDYRENDLVIVQAFSRNSAYAFKCSVERVCRLPFDYMHLSFPERVEGNVIRKATRVRMQVETRVSAEKAGDAVIATIENLSSTGALIRSNADLGAKGEAVKLAFRIELHDVTREIESRAIILNARREGDANHYGVEFRDLPPDERMILRSLVYQHIIEHPRSLV
ncbi:flagellar brake protein [Pseudazoarcus pumilus]|nr:flagellar brake protein [Pseudazoarcus pumilus]